MTTSDKRPQFEASSTSQADGLPICEPILAVQKLVEALVTPDEMEGILESAARTFEYKRVKERMLPFFNQLAELSSLEGPLGCGVSDEEDVAAFSNLVSHAENLWKDACLLFKARCYAPSLFLAIVALEKEGKRGREPFPAFYHLLKSGMSSLWRALIGRDRKVNMRLVRAGGKVIEGKYSLALSVMAEAAAGYRFQLLIEDSAGEEQFDAVITMFLDFLEAYHADHLDADLTKEIRERRVVGRTILLAYDKERKDFRVVDPIPRSEKRS
ncbi:MAG: hypothetical protein A2038_03405 [Deltaproteobacteria bacterium GWA2_57_13]|nr:MAG: hypothetical protein A2038_03405 [Deltaproteobacteria bacterium GWA2_57_13]